VPALQVRFLALLPRIELHGRVYFRHVRCAQQQAEYLQEMRALAWLWFVRVIRQGKTPEDFPSALASYAARAVRDGRRLCGQEPSGDVLAPRAQWLRGFAVSPLPDISTLEGNPFQEALYDNTQTPPPEQVAFRIDFPAWRRTRSRRNRRVIDELMAGGRTRDVAKRHGLTDARISQLRRELHADWLRFCGDRVGDPDPAGVAGPDSSCG
jgi:hypothetical protein